MDSNGSGSVKRGPFVKIYGDAVRGICMDHQLESVKEGRERLSKNNIECGLKEDGDGWSIKKREQTAAWPSKDWTGYPAGR